MDDRPDTGAPRWGDIIVDGIDEALFMVDRDWRFTFVNPHVANIWQRSPADLLGQVMWDVFPSLRGSAFGAFYRQAMADGQPNHLEAPSSMNLGRWYDVHVYPIEQGLIVFFQDSTPRKQAEAENLRQAQRAAVQAEMSRALAEVTSDYQRTLDMAAQQLAARIGDACIIHLVSSDGEWFETTAVHHRDPEARTLLHAMLAAERYQRVSEKLSGRVVQTGQPLLLPSLSSAQAKTQTTSTHWEYFDRFAISSALMVPLRSTGRVIGVIIMNRLAPSQLYNHDDLSLVQDLADRIAIAITNARLLHQLQSELAERTRTAAALRMSEERFKILSEATNEAVFIHDQGTIVEANERAVALFGYSFDELIGMSLTRLFLPESLASLRQAFTPDAEYTGESVAVCKDGTQRIVEVRGRPIDYQGQWVRLVALRDLTNLKRAEEAQRTSEARYTGIVASAMDAIISLDESLHIVVFNAAAEQMFCCSAATVLGQPLDRFLPPSVQHLHAAFIRAFGQTGTTSRSMHSLGTLTAMRTTGEAFPIEATISQTQASGERLYTVIIRDITERTQAEETLRKTQAQLLQAQKMDSIGQLAGGIAHDFNNLLSVIIGYCEMMLADVTAQDPLYPDVREILKASNRAADLVRQILAFSRQQVLAPQVVNLNETVEQLDKLLHRVIGEDIELVSLVDPHLAPVFVDPGQMEQVLVNLAVNARDAMPNGGQLMIETANVTLDEQYHSAGHPNVITGRYVMLAVSDTGIGMDQATQEKLFEPFFTTKEPGKGTGLGLATVYGIIRQSEGYIWVYSELGVGTTLKIYLPILEDPSLVQPQALPDRHHQSLARSAHEHTGQGRTILVVEDDISVHELIHRVLAHAGYTIMRAHNGHEALEVITSVSGHIDVVLTDIVMPQMGGRTLVERLKAQWPELKTVCMSGYTDRAVQRHGIAQPCDTFLQKPFTPQRLLDLLDDVLNTSV